MGTLRENNPIAFWIIDQFAWYTAGVDMREMTEEERQASKEREQWNNSKK